MTKMTHTGGLGKSYDVYVYVGSIEGLTTSIKLVFVSLPLQVYSPWWMAGLDNTTPSTGSR